VTALAGPPTPATATPAHLLAEAGRALGLTPDQQLLGFHACWLHHASNELDRGTAGGPVTAVVRALSPDERPV
jgi:hypothetical protein